MLEKNNNQVKSIHLDVFYSDELITRDELLSINENINPYDISLDYDIVGGLGGPFPAPIDLENILTVAFKPIIEGIFSALIYDIIKKLIIDIVFRLKRNENKIPVLFRKDDVNLIFFFDPKSTSKDEIDYYLRFLFNDLLINNSDNDDNGYIDDNIVDNEGEGKG